MRDLVFVAFVLFFIGSGCRRPFLFVLAYAYVDIVAPQRITYYLLNAMPISLIAFVLAFAGWLLVDNKRDSRFTLRQAMIGLLLVYCAITTSSADFYEPALEKWAWVWKALVFAMFLPLTLRTRTRMEALALVMVLSASSIIITGGIKTLVSGGGYGVLKLLVDDNTGLYESSIISCVAIAIIPLILWLTKYGTVYKSDIFVKLFAAGLIFACLLIPVGTQARTGLVCIAMLAILALRTVKRRMLYIGAMALAGAIAVPMMPSSFSDRMGTMNNYKADQSASTRVEVWKWTWEYAKDNPMGGGFMAYLQNKITISKEDTKGTEGNQDVEVEKLQDKARAYHSSYFEMLGEQGYPGLVLWLLLHLSGIWQMEVVRRRYLKRTGEDEAWIAPLANALQMGQIIYMTGSLFVGIAFQPFIYMMVALQIALASYLKRREAAAAMRPMVRRAPAMAGKAPPVA